MLLNSDRVALVLAVAALRAGSLDLLPMWVELSLLALLLIWRLDDDRFAEHIAAVRFS
jgi:hypothetical protein